MTDRLTIHDARKAGFCVAGVRRACDRFGIDFRSFVRNGVPFEDLAGIDDANLDRAINVAKERINGR